MSKKCSKRVQNTRRRQSSLPPLIKDPILLNSSGELKIMLFDCMQPRVLLERIKWPVPNAEANILNNSNAHCSSKNSKDLMDVLDCHINDDELMWDCDDAADESKMKNESQSILSELKDNPQFRQYIQAIVKRKESEPIGHDAIGLFDDSDFIENVPDYSGNHSRLEKDCGVQSNSEFCNHVETMADERSDVSVNTVAKAFARDTYDREKNADVTYLNDAYSIDVVDVENNEDQICSNVFNGVDGDDREFNRTTKDGENDVNIDETMKPAHSDDDDSWSSLDDAIMKRHTVDKEHNLFCDEIMDDDNSREALEYR